MTQERRVDERLSFPPSLRPQLFLGGKEHAVLDLSKRGVCFAPARGQPFKAGDRFSAMFRFGGGAARPNSGNVVRANKKCVAVRLETEIPVAMEAADKGRPKAATI